MIAKTTVIADGTIPTCADCEPIKSYLKHRRAVPVAMSFGNRMLCPPHALDAIEEAGLTLNEAMGCAHE